MNAFYAGGGGARHRRDAAGVRRPRHLLQRHHPGGTLLIKDPTSSEAQLAEGFEWMIECNRLLAYEGLSNATNRKPPQFGGATGAWWWPRRTSSASPRSSPRSWARWPSYALGSRWAPIGRWARGLVPVVIRQPRRWDVPGQAYGAGHPRPGTAPASGTVERRNLAVDLDFDGYGQTALGAVARDLFESRCPLTTVRALEDDPLGYQPELWVEMAGLDWLSLTYPESVGGSGAGVLDLATIYHQFGRTLTPSPHLPSAVVTGEVLSREPGLPRAELLTAMGRGETVVVPALVEADAALGAEAVGLPMVLDIDGYHLTGTKLLEPYATAADQLLVVSRSTAPPDGITLVLIDCRRTRGHGCRAHVPTRRTSRSSPSPSTTWSCLTRGSRSWEASAWLLVAAQAVPRPGRRPAVAPRSSAPAAGLLELAVACAFQPHAVRQTHRPVPGRAVPLHRHRHRHPPGLVVDAPGGDSGSTTGVARPRHGGPLLWPRPTPVGRPSGWPTRTHEVFAGVAFMLEVDVQLYHPPPQALGVRPRGRPFPRRRSSGGPRGPEPAPRAAPTDQSDSRPSPETTLCCVDFPCVGHPGGADCAPVIRRGNRPGGAGARVGTSARPSRRSQFSAPSRFPPSVSRAAMSSYFFTFPAAVRGSSST